MQTATPLDTATTTTEKRSFGTYSRVNKVPEDMQQRIRAKYSQCNDIADVQVWLMDEDVDMSAWMIRQIIKNDAPMYAASQQPAPEPSELSDDVVEAAMALKGKALVFERKAAAFKATYGLCYESVLITLGEA